MNDPSSRTATDTAIADLQLDHAIRRFPRWKRIVCRLLGIAALCAIPVVLGACHPGECYYNAAGSLECHDTPPPLPPPPTVHCDYWGHCCPPENGCTQLTVR